MASRAFPESTGDTTVNLDPEKGAIDAPAPSDFVRPGMRSRSPAADASDEIAAKARAAMSVASEVGIERAAPPDPGEGGAASRFDSARGLMDVLRAAVQVDSDPVEAGRWCVGTRIAEFGDITAAELVWQGRADEVIRFLHAIRDGARG